MVHGDKTHSFKGRFTANFKTNSPVSLFIPRSLLNIKISGLFCDNFKAVFRVQMSIVVLMVEKFNSSPFSFAVIQFTLLLYILLISKGCFSRPLEEVENVEVNESDDEEDYSLDDTFAQPVNLRALDFTQNSITLRWDLNDAEPDDVDSYRIFYTHHNFNNPDIKTIREPEPMHVLNGLEPFTQYEIKVVSIIKNGTISESQPSLPIVAQTDVAQPSAPIITNASCWGTGSIYLEWTKPER